MPLYIKSLSINEKGQLVSCHGGDHIWKFTNPRLKDGTSYVQNGMPQTVYVDANTVITYGYEPCQVGTLHALRVRDLPFWLGTHYAIVEMLDAKIDENKVYGTDQRIVRIADFDGLQMLVDFAEWCAATKNMLTYTDETAADFIAGKFPAGFLDGVEK